MKTNHEIDYKIFGEELQYVEIELDPQETVIGEPGGFMMMDDGIQMNTIFGDGSHGEYTADDWGKAASTINYEIVTRIAPRVPRIYAPHVY